MEEHVHVRQVGGHLEMISQSMNFIIIIDLITHRQRGHVELVLDVDGGAALDGEVEHAHVVEDHEDVRHRVAVGVHQVVVGAAGQDHAVALLLKSQHNFMVKLDGIF